MSAGVEFYMAGGSVVLATGGLIGIVGLQVVAEKVMDFVDKYVFGLSTETTVTKELTREDLIEELNVPFPEELSYMDLLGMKYAKDHS